MAVSVIGPIGMHRLSSETELGIILCQCPNKTCRDAPTEVSVQSQDCPRCREHYGGGGGGGQGLSGGRGGGKGADRGGH